MARIACFNTKAIGVCASGGRLVGRISLKLMALSVILLLWSAASRAAISGDTSVCDQAAKLAARETGVPVSVLLAITRTETGRSRNGSTEPWPWTVNMEGTGKWFSTKAEAQNYVNEAYNRGARSFDVGCFQLNYRWHGQNFSSIEQMFDPLENARYAARFLLELYAEKGNWRDAAGAYHSRTPSFATRYIGRFDRFRNALLQNDTRPPANSEFILASVSASRKQVLTSEETAVVRVNRYPLLQTAGGARPNGSLVPLAVPGASRRLIGD